MAHLHSVYDSDIHFRIDAIARTIKNESSKNSLVQYDHKSERFTFELPRYIEEHDMSLCNTVEIHYINVGANGEQEKGVYEVDDWQISPDDNSIVICSWLISANSTKYAGSLNFLIRFACLTDDSIDYAWHTEIYKGITVSDGMNNGEAVIEEYLDVLEAWKAEVLKNTATKEDVARLQNSIEDNTALIESRTASGNTLVINSQEEWDNVMANGFMHNNGKYMYVIVNCNIKISGIYYMPAYETNIMLDFRNNTIYSETSGCIFNGVWDYGMAGVANTVKNARFENVIPQYFKKMENCYMSGDVYTCNNMNNCEINGTTYGCTGIIGCTAKGVQYCNTVLLNSYDGVTMIGNTNVIGG